MESQIYIQNAKTSQFTIFSGRTQKGPIEGLRGGGKSAEVCPGGGAVVAAGVGEGGGGETRFTRGRESGKNEKGGTYSFSIRESQN